MYLLGFILQSGNYPCGSGLYVEITFYTSSCYQSCITRNYRNGVPLNGIIKQGCGVQCCNFESEWCEDAAGKPVFITSSVNPLTGPPCLEENLLKYVNCLNQQQVAERPCVYRCE